MPVRPRKGGKYTTLASAPSPVVGRTATKYSPPAGVDGTFAGRLTRVQVAPKSWVRYAYGPPLTVLSQPVVKCENCTWKASSGGGTGLPRSTHVRPPSSVRKSFGAATAVSRASIHPYSESTKDQERTVAVESRAGIEDHVSPPSSVWLTTGR